MSMLSEVLQTPPFSAIEGHCLIVGGFGTGKSVLSGAIVEHRVSRDERAFIIDVAGSHQSLAAELSANRLVIRDIDADLLSRRRLVFNDQVVVMDVSWCNMSEEAAAINACLSVVDRNVSPDLYQQPVMTLLIDYISQSLGAIQHTEALINHIRRSRKSGVRVVAVTSDFAELFRAGPAFIGNFQSIILLSCPDTADRRLEMLVRRISDSDRDWLNSSKRGEGLLVTGQRTVRFAHRA